jgi:hypothetical protein
VTVWFVYDGAQLHFTITARENLHSTCPEHRVGCGKTVTMVPMLAQFNSLVSSCKDVYMLLQSTV